MAKKTTKGQKEVIHDISKDFKNLETFYEEKKDIIIGVAVVICVSIASYFIYTRMYLQPRELEAKNEIAIAQKMFALDSFNMALNGGEGYGFVDIIDEFGGTESANLAHYYAGICELKLGNFEGAIEYLEDFDTEEYTFEHFRLALIGDAYFEMNDFELAEKFYKKSVQDFKNESNASNSLMKLAIVQEKNGKISEAIETLETLKMDFPKSPLAIDSEKLIGRLKAIEN